ncbi:MAG TPA: bifunctional phosphoglucose/phosphomannose isomerase [Candidatus Nanoarchaeia archaeon]|nr:bifunctional phosphoglucose/phosphomannose isomerase [Candidatus Nanoarchaeia archaeon]
MAGDISNMLGLLDGFSRQIKESLSLPAGITAKKGINKVVVAGMGGSAISGDLLAMFLDNSIPLYVVRGYTLPKFIDEKTLVFATSYSGNTEETLSVLEQAKSRGCNVIGITSDGELAEKGIRTIKIPSGMPPRYALAYCFFPMLGVLSNSGLVKVKNEDINELLSTLNSKRDTFKEKAKELSGKLDGKLPVIYASSRFGPVAYRFKTQLNENSKSPAYHHVFPELTHNEIVGYEGMDRRSYITIFIEDIDDHERIQKRMVIAKDIMKRSVDIISIKTIGNSLLCRVFATINLLDYISYYLAIRRRVDPATNTAIDELKERMKK